jgi:uncharacterized repeat protein (TIGR01451 family)
LIGDAPVDALQDTATAESVEQPPDEAATTDPTIEPTVEDVPEDTAPAGEPLRAASNVQPLGVQGVIGLDVSAPDTIRAGEYITYTYTYTNTSSSSVSGVEIDTIWANAHTTKTSSNAVFQYCPAAPDPITANCGLLTDSVQGPTVEVIKAPTLSGTSVTMRVRLGALGAGQNGKFSVRVRSNAAKYPKTGETITRPASSGRLYLSGQTTPTSEDTANTMIIGPVFVLTKTPTSTEKIYPVADTVEFVIQVGNASAPGDIVSGQRRADATPATNVVLTDTFPSGSELVSATPSGSVSGTVISWTIPRLEVGQVVEFRVRFRKVDNSISCDRLSNRTYNVTSNEMPMNGSLRYNVTGNAASVEIIAPMVIKSIVAAPPSVIYGNESTITIVVQNFWNQALSGVQLHYDIQPNAYYIAGSANPAPTLAPTGATLGGRVTWTFSMDAGTKTTPTEKTFSLKVRGGYTRTGTGTAQVVPPTGVPAGCIKTKNGDVDLKPRLAVKKYTDADPSTNIGNVYMVNKGQQFWYLIDITNNGVADATDVDLVDLIPSEMGANFSYVVGSATLNGVREDPDSFTNGAGGSIIWNNFYVPVGQTIRLRYALLVDGYYYVDYCNNVEVTSGGEDIQYISDKVCVKMNPQIVVTKTANKSSGAPGEEVEFRLTLTNRESATFRVGLYDYLREFIYVRQVSGYAAPEVGTNTLAWPLVNLGPGQQLQAVIIARLPDPCAKTSYENEALFGAEISPGVPAVVQPIPPVKARVSCSRLEYSKTVDRTTVSLGDKHIYTLTIKNANPDSPISNVVVDDMLPQGFSYVAMDGTSGFKGTPTQSARPDGRTRLSWTIPSIATNATTTIKFIALSGSVVGNHENWAIASVDGAPGTCKTGCVTVTEGDTAVTYAAKAVSVQPMITIAPEFLQTACAKPGDKRTYRLTIVNTNTHAYSNTTITATLPFGLNYVQSSPTAPSPRVITDHTGVTTLTWVNQTIPAKPANAFGSQVILEVELEVGNVWGELATVEQATSPDGLIPRKDGVQNASILVCPTQPSIAKEANRSIVRIGDEIRYIISLANTNVTAINATVVDQLPENVSYVGMVSGPAPTIVNKTLTWSSLSVPAAAGGKAGLTQLIFTVRVDTGEAGTTFTNTATVTSSAGAFDTTHNSVQALVATSILYFPVLQY